MFCNKTSMCRTTYYEDNVIFKVEVEKICPVCGVVFTTTKPLLQAYCTDICRKDARKIRASNGAGLPYQVEADKVLASLRADPRVGRRNK